MTSVWLATNGGSGEDGDEWLLFDIFATEEAANAHVAEENARRGFMEFEVEEWSVKGSPLTDEEREAIFRVYDLLCDRSRELQSATRLDEARPLIQWAKTLQGLWERLSGSAAISGAGKSAPAANTPPTLTDEERDVLHGVAEDASYRCADFTERVVRGLLERLK